MVHTLDCSGIVVVGLPVTEVPVVVEACGLDAHVKVLLHPRHYSLEGGRGLLPAPTHAPIVSNEVAVTMPQLEQGVTARGAQLI